MAKDYFSEEIDSNVNSPKDYFSEEIGDSKSNKSKKKVDVIDNLKAFAENRGGFRDALVKEAYANTISPGLSGANTALFGIPKFAMNRINPDMTKEVFPEQTTGFGKAARFAAETAGIIKGGAFKLGTNVAGKVIPRVAINTAAGLPLGLGRESAGLIQTAKRLNDIRNVQRAAVSGSIMGATQLNPESTIQSQALQAATGGILGAGVDRASGVANYAMREVKKFGYPAVRPLMTRISEVTKSANLNARDKINIVRDTFTKFRDDTVSSIKKNIDDLNVSLQKSAETGSAKFQRDLPEFFKKNSKAYGDSIDAISTQLSSSGQKITSTDIFNIASDSIKELDDIGIKSGAPRSYLEKLLKNNSADNVKELSFRDAVKYNKDISNLLSSSTKKGTYGFSEEDIPVAIFQKNLGNYISDISPEFKSLQDAYKPVIQAKIKAYQIFKPSRGDFYTKGGTDFIKRAANGKLEKGEKEFVEFLQSGSKLSGGVGDIISPSIKIGSDIRTAKQMIPSSITNINTKQRAEEDFIKYQLSKRISELTGRKSNVQDLLAQKAKLKFIKKAAIDAVAGAGLVGAGYGGFRLIHDIGR